MSIKLKNFAMPLVFLSALLFALIFGDFLSYNIKSFCYSVSLCIKEILIFSLPFIIFSLVFNSVLKLGTKALKFVIIIVPLICLSNFTNTILSYFTGILFTKSGVVDKIQTLTENSGHLTPMFFFQIKKFISNDIALISGFISGALCGIKNFEFVKKTSIILENLTKYFFKILIPLMPFFIVGTSLKLQYDGMLSVICSKYLSFFVVFIISAYGFVTLQYLLLSKFKISVFSKYIKNIFPAIITGFGSMSSAAALPLSIKAAEKNSDERKNASIIVPASVNIHLVGDCFFIPMSAIIIMSSFGINTPSFDIYLIFSLHFVLAKFAVAAVPGGGILVMLPILQNYLGFTPDMLGLITALYVLFDPVITSCNVAGNGSLAIIFDKITNSLSKILKKPQPE